MARWIAGGSRHYGLQVESNPTLANRLMQLDLVRTVKRTESLTYRNKKVYDGEFVQGMRHGRGQVYLPVDFVDDGSSQEGQALIEPRVLELGAFRSDIQDYGLSMNPSRLECRFGTSWL